MANSEIVPRGPANWFVRILIVLLAAGMAAMIAYRFIAVSPAGSIDASTLVLLAFIIVLVLAEAFDNFSVGQMITISREAKKREVEVEKLEKQNSSLLNQIINLTAAQASAESMASNLTILGDLVAPRVRQATQQEVAEREPQEPPAPAAAGQEERQRPPRIDMARVDEVGVKGWAENRKIDQANIITNATFESQFRDTDPISTWQPIFDGYYRDGDKEAFLDVRRSDIIGQIYRPLLYLKLAKIAHYRLAKNADANLELILVDVAGREHQRVGGGFERILRDFQPAIASGLLRVMHVNTTEDQVLAQD